MTAPLWAPRLVRTRKQRWYYLLLIVEERTRAHSLTMNNATKKNYLQTIQPNPDRRWRYSNFVLTLKGEHATLRYHLDRIDGDTTNSYNYVDTFVWRDHRWQATSSHQMK